MGYDITALRTLARTFVRNAASSAMYSDTQIDYAIMLAADQWQRITFAPRVLGSITLTANSATIGSAPTGWMPEYNIKQSLLLANNVVNPNITFGSYNEVLQQQWIQGTTSTFTGPPVLFAMSDTSNGYCYPTPDQDYTLLLWWRQPFTSWTAGGTCSGFNLPDDHLRIIATEGVEAYLQQNEPQNAAISTAARARYEASARQIRGRDSTGRGGNTLFKDSPDAYTCNAGNYLQYPGGPAYPWGWSNTP